MNDQQIKEVTDCLVTFVKRVANEKEASPAEIATLPEIVRVLCSMASFSAM